jgi:hypothetical protein
MRRGFRLQSGPFEAPLLTLPWFRDEARAATAVLIAWALLCILMVPTLPGGAVRLLGVLAALAALDAAERAWSRRRRAWRAYGISAAFMVTGLLFHESTPAASAVALLITGLFVVMRGDRLLGPRRALLGARGRHT